MIEIILHGITPAPQGSNRAIMIGEHARLVAGGSDKGKKRMHAFRKALALEAGRAVSESGKGIPYFGKHVPVDMEITFYFIRPKSIPKSRIYPVVKPDRDKLERAALDSLTGILYHDDSQVVSGPVRKLYASVEGVRILAREAGV